MNRNASSSDPAKLNEQILLNLLKIESNKYCADCGQKGTRWASWNIGVFLCIRCGGLHRALGTHISKVKSVTLDKWTDEQVESIKSKGNAIVNQLYNPHPDRHPFPVFSGDAENYIRDKYERKLFMDDTGISLQQSSSRMTLKKKASIVDDDLPEFKVSTPEMTSSSSPQFSKQLVLLTEMGFNDTEFNLKTLQAANGNLQEALEIIVAANQRLRKKKSISASTVEETELFGSINSSMPLKKSQPIVDLMDSLDLGMDNSNSSSRKSSATSAHASILPSTTIATNTNDVFVDDSNPWSRVDTKQLDESLEPASLTQEPVIEDLATPELEDEDDNHDDPLAFNPFKSTTSNQFSDDLFANPW